MSDWTDIEAIAAGRWHTVGQKLDGTVVAVGDDIFENGKCDVSDWTNIAIPPNCRWEVGKKQEERKKKNEEYWLVHAAEKKEYEEEKAAISSAIRQYEESIRQYDAEIKALKDGLNQHVVGEEELSELKKQRLDLESQIKALGVFAGKQKKQLREQSDSLRPKIDELESRVKRLREQLEKSVQDKVMRLEQKKMSCQLEVRSLELRNQDIDNELSRDRA